MDFLKNKIKDIIYKNGPRRSDDLKDYIILNKHIFQKLLNEASIQTLKAICLEFEIYPRSYEIADFGPWLEANRRLLELTQSEFGTLIGATQAEVSNIENASNRASFSNERAKEIAQRIINEIRRFSNAS